MRFTTRAQPPEHSPAPGVLPGAVHVHYEPDPAARPKREPERRMRSRVWQTRLRWRFSRGLRA